MLAVWLLLLTAGIALLAGTGLRLDLSGSLPLGFYRLTNARIERGALVATDPDSTIRCGKRMSAALWPQPGAVTGGLRHGIRVNGRDIEHSARLVADRSGRPRPPPPAAGAAPAGHVWLFSDHAPESFDSRYFAPVALSAMIGTAGPLGISPEISIARPSRTQ